MFITSRTTLVLKDVGELTADPLSHFDGVLRALYIVVDRVKVRLREPPVLHIIRVTDTVKTEEVASLLTVQNPLRAVGHGLQKDGGVGLLTQRLEIVDDESRCILADAVVHDVLGGKSLIR